MNQIRAFGEFARGDDPVRHVDVFVKTGPAVLPGDEQAMEVALRSHHPTAWHVFFRASMSQQAGPGTLVVVSGLTNTDPAHGPLKR